MWNKLKEIVAGMLTLLLGFALVCVPIALWVGGIFVFIWICVTAARWMGVAI